MLRSGNGQHRRPRQAPAFVVTAGATGAGIALPLLATTGAHAATTSTWDKVAQCESGGLWSADSGNGFYGGLQLTLSTWQKYGGTAYAERPDLASRQQQIAVAEKVLESEGLAAWQDCAVETGLSQGGPAPHVDPGKPGATPAPADSASTGRPASGLSDLPDRSAAAASSRGKTPPNGAASSSPGASATGSAASSADPSASGAPSAAPSGSPSAIPPLLSTVPSADASGAPGASSAADGSGSRGRHAKPVAESVASAVPAQGGLTTGDQAAAGSGPRASLVDSPGLDGGSYTVKPGDNLSQIAADHTASGDWTALYAANRSTVGSNPDLIRPGQHLTLG